MIARALGIGLAVPCCLLAQLQVFVVDSGSERAIQGVADLGAADAGDVLESTFRVRNGGVDTKLETLRIAGAGFTVTRVPPLPVPLSAGESIDFASRFQPTADGWYSANLSINGQSIILRAQARPGATVSLDWNGARLALVPGTTIEFGSVQRDSRTSRRIIIDNFSSAAVSTTVTVTGVAFRAAAPIESPVALPPGASTTIDIVFEPKAGGAEEGALRVGQRSFPLHGAGVEPAPPKPLIVFEPQVVRSGQQAKAVVRFSSASRVNGTGRLRVDFVSALPGAQNDPAIQFLTTGARSAEFEFNTGSESVTFSGSPAIDFQTGTTAGSLVFTAECGSQSSQATIPVPAAPVVIDSQRAVRAGSNLELHLTGFDNTRSVSKIAFTFFDQNGRALDPGRIETDAAADFRRYFDGSDVGGVFALRTVFPVSGNAGQVAGAEVELTNSVGTTRTGRIRF